MSYPYTMHTLKLQNLVFICGISVFADSGKIVGEKHYLVNSNTLVYQFIVAQYPIIYGVKYNDQRYLR